MEFRPFLPGNLKGGMISLGIGAAVYLLFVRRVLMRDGSYVDLWPEKLDLEEGLYPSWDAHNMDSVRLAEKLGYKFSHAYTAYEVDSTLRTH